MQNRNVHEYLLEKQAMKLSTMGKISLPFIAGSYGQAGLDTGHRGIYGHGASTKDEQEAFRRGAKIGLGTLAAYEGMKHGIPYVGGKVSKGLKSRIEKLDKQYRKLNPKSSEPPRGAFGRDRYVSRVVKNKDGTINFEESTKKSRKSDAAPKGPSVYDTKPKSGVVVNPEGQNLKEFGKKVQPLIDKMRKAGDRKKAIADFMKKFNYNRPVIGAGLGLGALVTSYATGMGAADKKGGNLKQLTRLQQLNPTDKEMSDAYIRYEKATGDHRNSMGLKQINDYIQKGRR